MSDKDVSLITWQTLIAGWDELECHRVFNFLCDITNLMKKVQTVITGNPGVFQSQKGGKNMKLSHSTKWRALPDAFLSDALSLCETFLISVDFNFTF